MDNSQPLLKIQEAKVVFQKGEDTVSAVDGISLNLHSGITLGLVGESGSGKSTLARAVMQLVPLSGGSIFFGGRRIDNLSSRNRRLIAPDMQMIFQDPGGSLNEYMRVGDIVMEPLRVHKSMSKSELLEKAEDLLIQVGLRSEDISKYPREFSGGQKQRIAIARSIALTPSLLVCDEPTSALDMSVQATIINLLTDLREEHKLTVLFISHDIALVHHFCDEVAVMSEGKIVEYGDAHEVIHAPKHFITQELIQSSQDWNLSDSPSCIR